MLVFDAVSYIIDALKIDDEPTVTNLALNKLLYFAQGHFLAQTGEALFDNDIEAWQWGPVVPVVYHSFKSFKYSPIIFVREESSQPPDEFEAAVLDDIIREYGKYSTSYLVTLSHETNSPWYSVDQNEVIPTHLMADYFARHPLDIDDLEMEEDCALFDELMANFSIDDYISEDEVFGI